MRARGRVVRQWADSRTKAGWRLKLHEAHCGICRHPQRSEIDRRYLNWESPRAIAAACGLSRMSVYRHVGATGLVERRRARLQFALDRMVERVSQVGVAADEVVAAVLFSAEVDGEL